MTVLTSERLQIPTLGPRRIRSPLEMSNVAGDGLGNYVPDEARVRYCIEVLGNASQDEDSQFEKAGPRERIFFDPSATRAAIVTCGGLCPGLNNVIRSLFLEMHYNYGVRGVLGIQNGYVGFNPRHGAPPIELTSKLVENIHTTGGTMLGTSRGPEEPAEIVDFLVQNDVQLLFCIGGDGTQRGAHDIFQEISRRQLPIAVVGIPKTIDNDVMYTTRSFGFSTALEKASEVIHCAHTEARGAPRGVGLVKLMGRDAGFIAAGAALASQEVNFVLIPEIRFPLDGDDGLLAALERRLDKRGHAVIVVAEGAGQHLFEDDERSQQRDASGNVKHRDIGALLQERIKRHFADAGKPMNLKYIDPSYIIRSIPANCDDSLLCDGMARHAVHAAMAGKTDLLVGQLHESYIHVPIPLAVAQKKQVSPEGELWIGVLACTGQPRWRNEG